MALGRAGSRRQRAGHRIREGMEGGPLDKGVGTALPSLLQLINTHVSQPTSLP